MQLIKLMPAALILFTSTAFSKCESGSETEFFCTTKTGDQIEVCNGGKFIQYSFGKIRQKPEILLRVPRENVSEWDRPVATYHSYAVNIPNRDTIYRVWTNIDWLTIDGSVEGDLTAGVDVRIQDKDVATIKCSKNTITSNFPISELMPQP